MNRVTPHCQISVLAELIKYVNCSGANADSVPTIFVDRNTVAPKGKRFANPKSTNLISSLTFLYTYKFQSK